MSNYIGINHDIRNVNGSHIQMPPWFSGEPDKGWGNLELPNVYALDTVQKYPHGTAFREGERTWFYTKYIGSVNTNDMEVITQEACDTYMFGKGLAGYAFQQDYAASSIYGVEGEPTIYIKTEAVTYVTERANDFYSGGYWTAYDTTHGSGSSWQTMGGRVIKQVYSGTTLVVGGYNITNPSILTLDQPLPANVTYGTATGTVMPNKWKLAVQGQDQARATYMPILGASCVGDISDYNVWLWLQTYGELYTCHWSSALVGATIDYVKVVWNSDGSMDPAGYDVSGSTYAYIRQEAGFVVSNSQSENGTANSEGYPIVYLTMMK